MSEEPFAVLLDVDAGHLRQSLGDRSVPLRRRRRPEDDRVAEQSAQQEAGGPRGDRHAGVVEQVDQNRRRRSDRLVSERDRTTRLDVTDAVVVDDLDDLRLPRPGDGLAVLVVIDEYQPLPRRVFEERGRFGVSVVQHEPGLRVRLPGPGRGDVPLCELLPERAADYRFKRWLSNLQR